MKVNFNLKTLSGLGKYFKLSKKPPIFLYGKKEFLIDTNKKKFYDFACGSGTTMLGHNISVLNSKIKKNIDKGIIHAGPHFITTSHINFYDQLSKFLKYKFNIFHTATNGSEATETALKLAFHHTKRKKIIYFNGSYHGRTGYSLLSSDMKGINKNYFNNKNFIKCEFNNIRDFKKKFDKHKKDLAAVIIEPIQGTSGFIFSNKKFLQYLYKCLRNCPALLIFDETWTGFGKTGYNFAYELYKIIPDVLILGKSIGGGLPLGLIAFNKNINHNHPGAQSSTFQGNVLAVNNSYNLIKYLDKIDYLRKVKKIESFYKKKNKILNSYNFVKSFRGIGTMWGIEIDNKYFKEHDFTNKIRSLLLENGLITWECGKKSEVIGLVPPLCVSDKSLQGSLNIILKIFNELKKKYN